jgi:predicted RND superfamily exporter protein
VAATNDAVAKDQLLLSIAAFIMVFCFCSFFFQSFVASFLLVLPLAVANLVVFGYMGYKGIGLDLQTLPVSTIAVGIGVDYGIYLLSRIKEEAIRFGDLERGVIEGVRTAGNAITITALIIIAGVAFWYISDIKFQSDMGFLLALVTVFHLLGTLFFLPTLVYLVRPEFIVKKIGV